MADIANDLGDAAAEMFRDLYPAEDAAMTQAQINVLILVAKLQGIAALIDV